MVKRPSGPCNSQASGMSPTQVANLVSAPVFVVPLCESLAWLMGWPVDHSPLTGHVRSMCDRSVGADPMPRRSCRTPPATPHRRALEGLLSLLIVAMAYDWTQGSEPVLWHTRVIAEEQAESAPFGRFWKPDVYEIRTDGWSPPAVAIFQSRDDDAVAVCTAAVAELWAGSTTRLSSGSGFDGSQRDLVCALPVPGRWIGSATRQPDFPAPDVPTGMPADVLANVGDVR